MFGSTLRLVLISSVLAACGIYICLLASDFNRAYLSQTGEIKGVLEPIHIKPALDWDKLKPVSPPIDPDVLALTDKERDGLFGPVKRVLVTHNFTSPTNPTWDPEWTDINRSDYPRAITYDTGGRRVSDVSPPGCGLPDPIKLVYDSKGRLVESLYYNMDGSINTRATLRYDDKRWLVGWTDYKAEGQVEEDWVYQYVLDEYGNWVGRIPICVQGCRAGKYITLPVECRKITYHK